MGNLTASDQPAAQSRAVERFLTRYRRRTLLRAVLVQSLAAFAVNEVVRWGSVLVWRRTGSDLRILNAGFLYLLVFWLLLARRWSPARTAATADRALCFKDRLVSFLDFARRHEVPAALRAAQAGETAAALAARGAAAEAAVPVLLWAAPLLLLASFAYPLLLPSSTVGITYFRPAVHREGAAPPGARQAARRGDAAAPQGEAGATGDAATRRDAERADTPASGGSGPTGGQRDEPSSRRPPLAGERHGKDIVPDSPLVSTRTGASLTKVVDPLLRDAATRRDAPAPSGTFAFRLLPRSAKGGTGEGGAGGENPEQVVVDFDAIPVEYRALVQRYFSLLGRVDGRAGTTEKEPS